MNDDHTPEGDPPKETEVASFEAGIKFGSLYHQFAGTPVSPESSASLARAMEDAIANQPHCEAVTVEMDTEAIAEAAGDVGYTELTGSLFEAEVVVDYEETVVVARMAMEDGYPLMQIESVR